MDSMLGADTEKATLAWLGGALEYAYSHGQQLALTNLEAVMEDVVFVEEMAARRTSCVDAAATPASLVTSEAVLHAKGIATVAPMRRVSNTPASQTTSNESENREGKKHDPGNRRRSSGIP